MAVTDRAIRDALLRKKLAKLRDCPDTLVVEELGLVNARVRVDIAVLNGCLHGYEIKSARDTLERLPDQLSVYATCLEKLTVVCACRHVDGVMGLAPSWSGVIVAKQGARGAMHFETIRRASRNPAASPALVAHLLWRNEAVEVLRRLNESGAILRRPRVEMYQRLGELMSVAELTAVAREFMQRRQGWRSDQPLG